MEDNLWWETTFDGCHCMSFQKERDKLFEMLFVYYHNWSKNYIYKVKMAVSRAPAKKAIPNFDLHHPWSIRFPPIIFWQYQRRKLADFGDLCALKPLEEPDSSSFHIPVSHICSNIEFCDQVFQKWTNKRIEQANGVTGSSLPSSLEKSTSTSSLAEVWAA